MTELEKLRKRKLQRLLSYGRGLNLEQWDELESLRKKDLIEKGLNPNHYNLDGRYCGKKLQFK